MKRVYVEKIISILEKIKENSIFLGKGSGSIDRREFRDVNTIWELGTVIISALDASLVPEEKRNQQVRKIVIKYDFEILGKQNDWSSYVYNWVTNFVTKEYFLKICKFAGYREDPEENRFRKGDMRYLLPIFTKISESNISEAKRNKLEKELSDDSILELGAHEFQELIVKRKGKEYTPWANMRDSLTRLHLRVDSITDKLEFVEERNKFRQSLGIPLISQISAALQLCVMTNEDDFNYGYELVKKQEFNKKAKTDEKEYLELLENLKELLKNFKTKNKLLQKAELYDYEQLASNLDAIKDEKEFENFYNRKNAITDVFG